MSTPELIALAAPIVDRLVYVSESFLQSLPGQKGGGSAIDHPGLEAIIKSANSEEIRVPGGSASNTARALAHLGHHCGLVGKIGTDPMGQEFLDSLPTEFLSPLFVKTTSPTAQVLVMMTPDGDRTQRAFLGASAEISSNDLDLELLKKARYFLLEGFALRNDGLVPACLEKARKAKVQTAMGLASFEIVQDHRHELVDILSRYVDVVFANADEAHALTGLPPEKSAQALARLCKTAVVTDGAKGCWTAFGSTILHTQSEAVKPVDTTGAGDVFAAGFLYGLLNELPMNKCAHIASIAGAEVTQVIGARLPLERWQNLRTRFKQIAAE